MRRTEVTEDVCGVSIAVLFVGRNRRVWVRKEYADGLLGETAFASADNEVVTDRATRWTVAVMPMRVEP